MLFCRLNIVVILFFSSFILTVKADFLKVEALQVEVDNVELTAPEKNPLALFSVNTGSFLYHAFPKNPDSNQYFDNQFISIERKFSEESDYSLVGGTFLNSQSNRCILLGMRNDLYRFNERLVIKGIYAYAGEFFVSAFEHCGDDGFYETVNKYTGIAFAPYIYHAAQYNFTDYWGLEAGLMLPGIVVMSMQWSF